MNRPVKYTRNPQHLTPYPNFCQLLKTHSGITRRKFSRMIRKAEVAGQKNDLYAIDHDLLLNGQIVMEMNDGSLVEGGTLSLTPHPEKKLPHIIYDRIYYRDPVWRRIYIRVTNVTLEQAFAFVAKRKKKGRIRIRPRDRLRYVHTKITGNEMTLFEFCKSLQAYAKSIPGMRNLRKAVDGEIVGGEVIEGAITLIEG